MMFSTLRRAMEQASRTTGRSFADAIVGGSVLIIGFNVVGQQQVVYAMEGAAAAAGQPTAASPSAAANPDNRKTGNRPPWATMQGWVDAVGYDEGKDTAGDKFLLGSERSRFVAHTRKRWMCVEIKEQNTTEWNEMLRISGAVFAKDLAGRSQQYRIICRVCSMGENQDLINVGCKSTNNMVAPLDEPAPEWDPVKGIWKKSPAWFSSKTPVRHEIRTDHTAIMFRMALKGVPGFENLLKPQFYQQVANAAVPQIMGAGPLALTTTQSQPQPASQQQLQPALQQQPQPAPQQQQLPLLENQLPQAQQQQQQTLAPVGTGQTLAEPIPEGPDAQDESATVDEDREMTPAEIRTAINGTNEEHEQELVRTVFAIALDAHPLSEMPQRCASLRAAKAPGFADVHRSGATYYYEYENVDCGTSLLQLHSAIIKLAQRVRLSKSPYLTVQGDGGQVQKLHTFDIAIRYFNIETNTTHTEFFAMVNCKGTGEKMCEAILDALGPDLIVKLVGGSFDGTNSMMGEFNGVQALLREYAPFAIFIHCVAHRIALVSKHSVAAEGAQIESFISDVLPKLYKLTNKSDTRMTLQQSLQAEFEEPENGFVKAGETRWLSNLQASERVKQERDSTICLVDELAAEPSCITDITFLHTKMHQLNTIALIHIVPMIILIPADMCKRFQSKDICVGDVAPAVEVFNQGIELYANADYGVSDWGLKPLLDSLNFDHEPDVTPMRVSDDGSGGVISQQEQEQRHAEGKDFAAFYQEPLELTGAAAKAAEFKTLSELPDGARLMMDFNCMHGWYGGEIVGPDSSPKPNPSFRSVRFDDFPWDPELKNVNLKVARQITELVGIPESEEGEEEEEEEEEESGSESDEDEDMPYVIGLKTQRNGSEYIHELHLAESNIEDWEKEFESMVHSFATAMKNQFAEYFPIEGKGSEFRWWSVLTPSGIPDVNTPENWAALHSGMSADTKIRNLAEHFGCSTHFRRMLSAEAALLEVGDEVKAWWEKEEDLQSGKIGKKNTDSTFQIFYDDDEDEAQMAGEALDDYRDRMAEESPEQFGRVASRDLMKSVEATLDCAQLIDSEWPRFKLNAASYKQQAGTTAQSSRKFATWLLTSPSGPSEASYPNLRILLRVMLGIPASSVQPERDFSLENRIKVKGRSNLKVQNLDAYMRVYSVPRSLFFDKLTQMEAKPDANVTQINQMRNTPVAHLLEQFNPTEVHLAWVEKRLDRYLEARERRAEKRATDGDASGNKRRSTIVDGS